jgi:hypothetical protein
MKASRDIAYKFLALLTLGLDRDESSASRFSPCTYGERATDSLSVVPGIGFDVLEKIKIPVLARN